MATKSHGCSNEYVHNNKETAAGTVFNFMPRRYKEK
jgi:hypothetical protein